MAVNPRIVWGSLFAVGAAYETWAINNSTDGDTLSEVIRDVLHVDRREGKALFLAAYLGFSAWFVPHIVNKAAQVVRDLADVPGDTNGSAG